MHKRRANHRERSAPREAHFVVDYAQKNSCTNYAVPTGNLDSRTSEEVIGLLKMSVEKYGQTLVMITHDEDIAQIADRILVIEDGKVEELR